MWGFLLQRWWHRQMNVQIITVFHSPWIMSYFFWPKFQFLTKLWGRSVIIYFDYVFHFFTIIFFHIKGSKFPLVICRELLQELTLESWKLTVHELNMNIFFIAWSIPDPSKKVWKKFNRKCSKKNTWLIFFKIKLQHFACRGGGGQNRPPEFQEFQAFNVTESNPPIVPGTTMIPIALRGSKIWENFGTF